MFVEAGPGDVLTKLAKRAVPAARAGASVRRRRRPVRPFTGEASAFRVAPARDASDDILASMAGTEEGDT